eukprot:FR736619.1.p1 GENE.FR736619.1~~FR736619.1.p1  ORF type:complete len:207 (+),score=20.24 FR736619.1:33-653(+)
MDVTPQLPCGHEYCKSCMVHLREQRVAQTCPLCRKPLPPGPDKLYDLGYRIYMKVRAEVEPDLNASWEHISLSPAQQERMDQARALLLEAAAQGHMYAQAICGNMYDLARGVAKDERLAFVCYENAAEQGHMVCQYKVGIRYREGLGCEKNFEHSAYWFEQASDQGHPNAMSVLGSLYNNGHGVSQSTKREFELLQQSMALGEHLS